MTKLCKDCANFNPSVWCHAPENGVNVVSGGATVRFADSNRRYECGPGAKFFKPGPPTPEPKLGFWAKLFKK